MAVVQLPAGGEINGAREREVFNNLECMRKMEKERQRGSEILAGLLFLFPRPIFDFHSGHDECET